MRITFIAIGNDECTKEPLGTLSWMGGGASGVPLFSDHNESLLAAEQERILIDHRLYDVLQVGPHRFEAQHVGEFDGKERRPPADGQVLAVHAVELRVLRHSGRV